MGKILNTVILYKYNSKNTIYYVYYCQINGYFSLIMDRKIAVAFHSKNNSFLRKEEFTYLWSINGSEYKSYYRPINK